MIGMEVDSKSSDEIYTIRYIGEKWVCDCRGYYFSKSCWHIKDLAPFRPVLVDRDTGEEPTKEVRLPVG